MWPATRLELLCDETDSYHSDTLNHTRTEITQKPESACIMARSLFSSLERGYNKL